MWLAGGFEDLHSNERSPAVRLPLLFVGTRATWPHLLVLTAGMGLHLTIYHLLCYPALEQSLQQAVVQDKQDAASSAHHVPGPPKMVLSGLTTEPTVTPVAV